MKTTIDLLDDKSDAVILPSHIKITGMDKDIVFRLRFIGDSTPVYVGYKGNNILHNYKNGIVIPTIFLTYVPMYGGNRVNSDGSSKRLIIDNNDRGSVKNTKLPKVFLWTNENMYKAFFDTLDDKWLISEMKKDIRNGIIYEYGFDLPIDEVRTGIMEHTMGV